MIQYPVLFGSHPEPVEGCRSCFDKLSMTRNFLNLFFIFFLIASCRLDPKYQTPKTDVPLEKSSEEKTKISKISWKEFFKSADLQRVIQLALDNNKDLKVANLNIESTQAAYGIVRSSLLPTVSGVASKTRQGVPSAFSSFTAKKQFRANLTLSSYELDFFGRLRSLKKSALEDFLATAQARNVTEISLIAETANAYSQLLLDQKILEISEANFEAQSKKTDLIKLRYENGIDSKSTFLTALALVEAARITVDSYSKIVEQDKNSLMLLTGVFSEKSLPKITSLDEIKIAEKTLDLIPSEVLLSRPDIKQAEHELKAANADIGAARAAFFPSISLTGNYGYGSKQLSSLFDSKAWTFAPQINLPIFSGGKNFANLKSANVQKKIEIIQYEKAIQTAFREAKDELAARESLVSQLKSSDEILDAKTEIYEISQRRNKAGIINSLDRLDSEMSMLASEEDQATTKKEYIANLINLYKVFGGGSELKEEEEI
jgi:multidrug efflux system outer membrane protein